MRTLAPDAEKLRRGGPVAQQSFRFFAEAIEFHIDRSLSLIAEQAFERGKGELFLRPFLDRCDIVQIVCGISRAAAIARFEQRRPAPIRQHHQAIELGYQSPPGTAADARR